MVVDTSSVDTISVLGVPDVIHIGYDLMEYIAADLTSSFGNFSNFVIITDNHLGPLYLQKIITSIQPQLNQNQRLLSRILVSGESSKSRQGKASIEDFLLDSTCTRDTCLIALGGGVIGDLVGYVASTFMRGIPFVQIPTTLLAMVDSSIGGKTAIDTPHGKNLIGTFWQPKRIYLDLTMLQTLPKRELANGMAEVIKTAAMSSESEFAKLETGKNQIESAILGPKNASNQHEIDSNRAFLSSVINASVRFKANVVTQDEREGGLRGLLNFGHSIGHAYEAILSPAWLHGECVSIGLLHETELSMYLGHCSPDAMDRLKKCLDLYDLPVEFDQDTKNKLFLNEVMDAMKIDKKNKGAQKRIVLLSDIGKTLEQKASDVPDSAIGSILAKYTSTADSKQTLSKKVHASITDEDCLLQFPVSLRLIPGQTNMLDSIRELATILFKKFGLLTREKNGGSEIECIAENGIDTIFIYFTKEAGSSQSSNIDVELYEYTVLPQQTREQFLSHALCFIKNILGQASRHIAPLKKSQSTFVTPTVSNYDSVVPSILNQWVEHADAVEYRVDHLIIATNETQEWITTVGTQLAHLRQMTDLPIIYTIRTVPQAGKFDPALTDLYYQLILWGHRWGCEYVDVELTTLSQKQLHDVIQLNQAFYPSTKIIASFHDPEHRCPWLGYAMRQMYMKAITLFNKFGHTGVIKLVGYANSMWDNIELEQFRHQIDPHNEKEIILINMGSRGKLSRVSNQFLSPATHPTLSSPAAPGQLSVAELAFLRNALAMDSG